MVKRIAAAGVVPFVLWAACAAVGQDGWQSLPDAPSARVAIPAPGWNGFVEKARFPLGLYAPGGYADAMRRSEFGASGKTASNQRDPEIIFRRYWYPSSPKRFSGQSAGEGSLMGRATHAAAQIFVTRDESGTGRLNTSYFLRALTLVAADTASRPYWRRSPGEPLSAFGSNVGNEAGMNLLHEFGPGLKHMMKDHAPRFVAQIAERLSHN